MQRLNISGCQKTVSETKCHLSIKIECPFSICRLNVGTKNNNVNIPLISDKYNIMVVMQKVRFMQEFTIVINVGCLHSSLHAKLLMHNCARAKHAKHVFVA